MNITNAYLAFIVVPVVISTGIISFTASESLAETSKEQEVEYPEGYRDWTHVKSMILLPDHPFAETFGGLHHVYANETALRAMKAGTDYPDGSVLVFDLLETSTDEQATATVEGHRIRLDVMQKDASLWFDTGGWGYETFQGDSRVRLISDPNASCHGCHKTREGADYVFSEYRD